MNDETPTDKPKITRQQRIFCDLYLTGLSGSACVRQMQTRSSKPSERPDLVACRWLKRPAVQEYLKEQRNSQEQQFGIRKERVLRRLYHAAEGNPQALIDKSGAPIDINSLTEEAAAMIAGIDVEDIYEGHGENRIYKGQLRKVKLVDSNRAAEVLGRMMGWNRDKLEIEDNSPPPIIHLMPYPDEPADDTVPAKPPAA